MDTTSTLFSGTRALSRAAFALFRGDVFQKKNVVNEKNDEDFFSGKNEVKGDLPVDVYNTPDTIVIIAQMAGVDADNVVVKIKDDVVTISGIRVKPMDAALEEAYLHTEECQWGEFTRPIILPQSVNIKKMKARLTKEKILILTIPKKVVDDEHVVRVVLE